MRTITGDDSTHYAPSGPEFTSIFWHFCDFCLNKGDFWVHLFSKSAQEEKTKREKFITLKLLA